MSQNVLDGLTEHAGLFPDTDIVVQYPGRREIMTFSGFHEKYKEFFKKPEVVVPLPEVRAEVAMAPVAVAPVDSPLLEYSDYSEESDDDEYYSDIEKEKEDLKRKIAELKRQEQEERVSQLKPCPYCKRVGCTRCTATSTPPPKKSRVGRGEV